jgi:hypothetical protein
VSHLTRELKTSYATTGRANPLRLRLPTGAVSTASSVAAKTR